MGHCVEIELVDYEGDATKEQWEELEQHILDEFEPDYCEYDGDNRINISISCSYGYTVEMFLKEIKPKFDVTGELRYLDRDPDQTFDWDEKQRDEEGLQ